MLISSISHLRAFPASAASHRSRRRATSSPPSKQSLATRAYLFYICSHTTLRESTPCAQFVGAAPPPPRCRAPPRPFCLIAKFPGPRPAEPRWSAPRSHVSRSGDGITSFLRGPAICPQTRKWRRNGLKRLIPGSRERPRRPFGNSWVSPARPSASVVEIGRKCCCIPLKSLETRPEIAPLRRRVSGEPTPPPRLPRLPSRRSGRPRRPAPARRCRTR